MAQNTVIATKISTKTKVAVGIAVVAGGLAVANALIPLITFSVSILAPSNKATVSGTVSLSASTSQTATSVIFSIPSSSSAKPVTIAASGNKTGKGWTASWDTTKVPNGIYTIDADAVDATGKKATSSIKYVKVQNGQSSPTPSTGPVCGNGQCETGETTASCAADCPAPPPTPPATNTPPTPPATNTPTTSPS